VGAAVLGVLADLPALGLAGAVVAAVPAVLAARRVPALHAERTRARSRAERAEQALAGAETSLSRSERALAQATDALALADRALATRAAENAVAALQEAPVTVDLVRAEERRTQEPTAAAAVDLVEAPEPVAGPASRPEPAPDAAPEGPSVPSQQPAQHLVHHAGVASARVGASAPSAPATVTDGRVDTAELQRIWDLGEAARSRTGRGRRVRTGAEVDALPDRPRNVAGHRRRARHRA
jgi:hypothetical protein